MRTRFFIVCCILLMTMLFACSSENKHMITGKWTLTGKMIGGSPSSFWVKWNGAVMAPWETRSYALLSEGTFDFTDDTHIRIIMSAGHYKGKVYNFEIIKLDENEMTLGSDYDEIRLKRVME